MKKVLFIFISLYTLLFLSCKNFFQGSELKEQIANKIEIANSESFTIAINPLIDGSIISLTPSGNVETKKGRIINIEAKIDNAYTFIDWKIFSKKNGIEISDWTDYLQIGETDTDYRGTEILKKVSLEIKSFNDDLEIVPYCVPKIDAEGPKFAGEFNVATSEENLANGKIFTLAEFDLEGNLIRKGGNRANQLSFDIFVYDNVKPSKILIKETIFRDQYGDNVDILNPGKNDYSEKIIDDCFFQYQKNVFEAKFNYDFQQKRDGLLLIQVKTIDESENLSDETKSFIVSKDTTAGNISIFTCTDDNNYYNRASTEKINYGVLQEERKTIHWQPIIDSYFAFTGNDGNFELIEETIDSFELKYGFSEECSEGSVIIQSQEDSVFTHKTYEYNNTDRGWFVSKGSDTDFIEETHSSCSYKLPDYLFEENKDVYLCATVKDSLDNISTYKTVLLAKPEKPVINYINIGPARAIDGGEAWIPILQVMSKSDFEKKYQDFFQYTNLSMCYRLFYSKKSVFENLTESEVIKESSFYDNSQKKINIDFVDRTKGIILFNFEEITNSILRDYNEANQGDVLGYYYLQAGITDYNTQFLAGDLLEVPVIKGEIFGEPISSININFQNFYVSKIEGKIPDAPEGCYGFKHEIKIPVEYDTYKWKFYYLKPTFYYSEKEEFVPMNYDKNNLVYYFWQRENTNTKVIAEAYDNLGNKIYSNIHTLFSVALNLDHMYPYNYGTQYTGPVDIIDYCKFPLNIDYGNFTLSNYAGSGLKIVVFDDTGIAVDETNKSYIEVQFLPGSIYKNRYTMWDEGVETYNKYKLYEKPYYYTQKSYSDDPPVKNDKLHDFVIPLYLFNEGEVVNCINSMKDSSPEENSTRDFVGVFDWNRMDDTICIDYDNSICTIKDSIELNSTEFDEKNLDNPSMYSFTVEKFNTEDNLWKKEYSNYDYSKINNQYSITTQGSFYRARSSNAKYNGILNTDGYYQLNFTTPHYFYDTNVETKENLVIQGINGVQLQLNQPVLIQTYYANKNLGNRLSEWELQASDVNVKVYDPDKDGNSIIYYYDDNSDATQIVPNGYYYIVAVYFANGKRTCTSVMQK